MSVRFAPHATVFTMALTLLLSPLCWAQQETQTRSPAGGQRQNPTARSERDNNATTNRNQATSGVETIRGVISGVTTEGELVLDFRTNAAARTEGAFLTVVGSPMKSEAGTSDRQASGAESEQQHGWSGKKRHNIYIAWLSPRAKVFEAIDRPGQSDRDQRSSNTQGQGTGERKEITFDQLQVGDHVEIQFSPQEESGANNVHQNQQMRRTHGRDRTFVGYAMSIVVRPAMEQEKSHSGVDARPNERPQ
jgi:hypothetical protein